MHAGQGAPARPRPGRRPAVVGPRRAVAVRRLRDDVGRRRRCRPVGLRRIRAPSPGSSTARSTSVDRRRATAGKVGGAFCLPVRGDRSRCCSTSTAASTRCRPWPTSWATPTTTPQLADRTPLQRPTPDGPRRDGQHLLRDDRRRGRPRRSRDDRPGAWILDADLAGACQVVVDIHSRFLFERSVFARRRRRTLSVAELRELMIDAQAEAYGDGLDRRTATRHVGGQAALLHRLLQLALHLRAALRPRAVRPVPGRPRPLPRPATTTCCRPPGWTPPRSWRAGSASTSPTRRSGPPASTCSAPASTDYVALAEQIDGDR